MERHATDLPSITPAERYDYNRITFWLNGKPLTADVPPAQTTLEFLQQNVRLYGTKCSCNEGDCGACTVTVARPFEGAIFYEAVNSCLYTAAKLHGKHLITVEGLGTPEKLHPIQQAMLDHHSTQCGYCSPGFVMSLFALLASVVKPSEEQILAALEGNLCRCTGYESILKASRHLAENYTPGQIVPDWCRAIEPQLFAFKTPAEHVAVANPPRRHCRRYLRPTSLEELDSLQTEHPQLVIVNGGTDIMVQMNVQRKEYPVLLDLSGLPGLEQITFSPQGVRIGANVTYTDLQNSGIVRTDLPWLHKLVGQIASRQIRNFATLAGNIANASPIGDTLPLLLVLDALLVLRSATGERTVPLREFFLGYRQTALQKGEIILAVIVPRPARDSFVRVTKAAKRKAVDISSVVTAVLIRCENGIVCRAELALGGVAPTPLLSRKFSNALLNMEVGGLHPQEIGDFVAGEFTPISDVRGTDKYRSLLISRQVRQYLEEFIGGGKP